MRILICFFVFCMSLFSQAQISWMSMNKALEAQKKEPRKILINFYTDEIADSAYAHPVIMKWIQDKYYAVKFKADGHENVLFKGRNFESSNAGDAADKPLHPFAGFMNIGFGPSIVFLDEKGQTITQLKGLFSAREIEPYLSMIGSEDYKNIKTREQWDHYQRKFKSKIKE